MAKAGIFKHIFTESSHNIAAEIEGAYITELIAHGAPNGEFPLRRVAEAIVDRD